MPGLWRLRRGHGLIMAAAEMAILVFIGFVLPMVVLVHVADSRGQTRAYGLWALLGYVGLILGMLIMMASPRTWAACLTCGDASCPGCGIEAQP